jgi:hypothetical protein
MKNLENFRKHAVAVAKTLDPSQKKDFKKMLAIVAQNTINEIVEDVEDDEHIVFFINSYITDGGEHGGPKMVLGNILSSGHGYDLCEGRGEAPLNPDRFETLNQCLEKYDLMLEIKSGPDGWTSRLGLIGMLGLRRSA